MAATPAAPPKPKIAATIAMIKNMIAKRIMIIPLASRRSDKNWDGLPIRLTQYQSVLRNN
jgi:hypothetical protein